MTFAGGDESFDDRWQMLWMLGISAHNTSEDGMRRTDRKALRVRTKALFRTFGFVFKESSSRRSSRVAIEATSDIHGGDDANSALYFTHVE